VTCREDIVSSGLSIPNLAAARLLLPLCSLSNTRIKLPVCHGAVMDEIITPRSIERALHDLQALRNAILPENTELAELANRAQRAVLKITLHAIDDAGRRAMMLASSGVLEHEDGSMSVENIFDQDKPHLIAVEAVANAIGWLELSGYLIIKDPRLGDDG
jgi:hypothetical protein